MSIYITEEECENIICEEQDEFELIEGNLNPDHERWTTYYNFVVKHIESGKHYMGYWRSANTECQENIYSSQNLIECELKEVVTSEWVMKEI